MSVLDIFGKKPTFELTRFKEHSESPITSDWSIRLLYPDRMMKDVQITLNDVLLPWWDKPVVRYDPRNIPMNGGVNVRTPKPNTSLPLLDIFYNEMIVKVWCDGKVIRRVRFGDLREVEP